MSEPNITTVDIPSSVALDAATLAFATNIVRASGFVADVAFAAAERSGNPFASFVVRATVTIPAGDTSAITVIRATSFVRGVIGTFEALRARQDDLLKRAMSRTLFDDDSGS